MRCAIRQSIGALGAALLLALPATAQVRPAADPMQLQSDSLTLRPGQRLAHATGQVHAFSSRFEIHCDEATATYAAGGGPRRIERLVASGQVRVRRLSDGLTATAQKATWDAAADTVVLEGDPLVQSAEDRLSGERMTFGVHAETLQVERPHLVTAPDAQTGRPLDVAADRLEVVDAGRHARFQGHVVALDGESVTRSDRLDAYLAPAKDGEPAQVKRLVFSGRVDSRRGRQQAGAARAVYDLAASRLTLEGSPWVREDGELLQGERIVVDTETGQARVTRAVVRVKGNP